MTNIADKIAKLIAKADSSTHPEEADAFIAKAHALMEQHGISLLELGTLDAEDAVGSSQADNLQNNNNANWRFGLAGQLANYFGCRLVGTTYGNFTRWTVVGRQSARTTFELMWPYIDRQVLAVARELTKQGHYPSNKHGHKAVGRALTLRLHAMNNERNKTATPSKAEVSAGTALVPVDAIEDEMARLFPKLRTTRMSTSTDTVAVAAAKGISVDHQVARRKAQKKLSK